MPDILIHDYCKKDFEDLLELARYGANNAMIGVNMKWEELPPHGDLISRDDLLHTMRCHLALYDSCPEDLSLADKSRRDEIQNAIADIFNAPVVVPAERREGDG